MNTAYARVMGDHRPARVIVPTSELRRDAQIAMSAIAAGPA
jgi:enamine deaminase RidA (YjgF/YER057c/UK114 family)